MLDIVVTHYQEPWEIGKPFFDMLGIQKAVDFDSIHVMLIHDGTEPFPDEYFSKYPYDVEQIRIEHGGVSAARNAGIDRCTEKWVQFCDFDDLYTSVFSLKLLMDVLDTDRFDLLWGEFYSVDKKSDGGWAVHVRGENVVFVHGKVFRRKWLKRSGLRFDTDLEFNEDCLFCTTAMETIPTERIGHIDAPFPFYTWCYTPKSATATQENWWRAYVGGYRRNIKCVELFKSKSPERYQAMVARTVWDAYHAFNLENIPEGLKPCLEDFRGFWKEHKMDFWTTDPDSMAEVREISRKQYETGESEALERWGNIPMQRRHGVKIKEWLEGIETGVF